MVYDNVEINQAVTAREEAGQSTWGDLAGQAYIAEAACHARPTPQPQPEAPRNNSESHSTSTAEAGVSNQIRVESNPNAASDARSNSTAITGPSDARSTAITGPSNANAETGPSSANAETGAVNSQGGDARAAGGNVNFTNNSRYEVFNPTQAPAIIQGEGTSVYTRLQTRNGAIEAAASAANRGDSGALNVFVPGTVGVGVSFGSVRPDGAAMDNVVAPGVQNQQDLVGTFLAIEAQNGAAPNSGRLLQQQIVQQRIQRNGDTSKK